MAMSLSLAVTAGAANLSDYSDSEQVTAKYATAVDFASQLGILEGFDDGKYHPQGTLTRAQLATMVYRMTTADVADVYTANFAGGAAEAFSDTAATAWYAGYVGYAADAELLKGLGDGTYAPNDALTGYAALAAFLRGVGYDEPGHNFVGADWTVEVAKVAKQAGVLEGITNVDLNKPITREVAAQMIYNIMFSDMVAYTPAFGYQEGILGAGDTLAKDEFDIVSDKDGDNANVAPWGRPATIWVAKDGSDVTAAVTIEATPVATYTTAVNECDLSKELGETGNWSATQWHNGGKAASKIAIEATDVKNDVAGTAQGVLTEVYEVEKDVYEIVEIQTWMAEVTDVVKATFDKNGHEKTPAATSLKAWNNENVATVTYAYFDAETEAFAEESYVLMNNSWFSAAAGKVTVGNVVYTPDLEEGVDYGVLNLTAATPVATGEMTAYNNTDKTSTIGGTVYNWAEKFGLGFKGTVGTTYDVYVDFYGNVIGIEVPATVYTYGIITKMAWNNSQTILEDAKAFANILDFGANPESSVWMSGIENVDGTVDPFTGVAPGVQGNYDQAKVSVTAANNETAYYNAAYKFETLSDGSKVIVEKQNQTIEKDIENSVPTYFEGGIHTNDNTVYLVKTGNADDGYTYTSYNGYKTIPSMDNVDVDYFNDGLYVTYMYVDASVEGVVFPDSSVVAFISDDTIDGETGDLNVYEMYINGEEVSKTCAKTLSEVLVNAASFSAGIYVVSFDIDGVITAIEPAANDTDLLKTITNVKATEGTVIENDTVGYNCTDAAVYVVGSDMSLTVGDFEDIEAGDTVFAIMNDAGTKAVALYVAP